VQKLFREEIYGRLCFVLTRLFPRLTTRSNLNTDKSHLDEDLMTFRAMLNTVKIAPHKH